MLNNGSRTLRNCFSALISQRYCSSQGVNKLKMADASSFCSIIPSPGYYFPTTEINGQTYQILNNGVKMPMLGMGTWQATPEETFKAIQQGVKMGFRHFDTAPNYCNEEAIGTALESLFSEGVVKRSDIFLTAKLGPVYMHRDDPVPTLKQQLAKLKLDYVDLYLIHTPFGMKKTGPEKLNAINLPFDSETQKFMFDHTTHFTETWKGMEEVYRLGLAKAIGFCNFNIHQVEDILLRTNIRPAVIQIESHPCMVNGPLIQYCQQRNIAVTAYAPLANPGNAFVAVDSPKYPKPMQDERLKAIASKYPGKTVANIMLRWQLQRCVTVIPKTIFPHEMKNNLEVFSFSLSRDDMATVESLDRGQRTCTFEFFPGALSTRDYPFDELRE